MILDFLFPKQLGRLGYFIRVLPWNYGVWALTLGSDYSDWSSSAALAELGGAFVLMLYGVFFILLPRARDAGLPGWSLALGFVPYLSALVSLVLLLKPSRSGLRFTGENHRLETPPTAAAAAAVAGSSCAQCGQKLMLATDGTVTAENLVICNDCAQAGR